jgi:hypothetical protein
MTAQPFPAACLRDGFATIQIMAFASRQRLRTDLLMGAGSAL